MLKVYLAGPVDPDFPWRDRFIEETRLCLLNFRFPHDVVFVDPLKHLSDYIANPNPLIRPCVVNLDLAAVTAADVVFAYFWHKHFPIGTVCELKHARDRCKPTFVAYDQSLKLQNHPWLPFLASDFCQVPDARPTAAAFYFARFLSTMEKALF